MLNDRQSAPSLYSVKYVGYGIKHVQRALILHCCKCFQSLLPSLSYRSTTNSTNPLHYAVYSSNSNTVCVS